MFVFLFLGSNLTPIFGYFFGPSLGSFWAVLGLSWAVLGLSWACLGLSWTVLGLSWAILKPGSRFGTFKDDFGTISGSFRGSKFDFCFGNFGGHFWDKFLATFSTNFGAVLGSILVPDRPRRGPRWAQEGHQELQRPKNLILQKP